LKITATEIPEVLLLEPRIFRDSRGFFFESYNRRDFRDATGVDVEFVQDNESFSMQGVLRGLHYQIRQPQGKLVHAVEGEIFDVAVDLRRSSTTFGRWVATVLSARTHRMIWIPPGFAHGYLALSDRVTVLYKATAYYAPAHERTILWSDPALAVQWPLSVEPIVAEKDLRGASFKTAEVFD